VDVLDVFLFAPGLVPHGETVEAVEWHSGLQRREGKAEQLARRAADHLPRAPLGEVARQVGLVHQGLNVVRPGQLRDLAEREQGVLGDDVVDLGPIVEYSRADLVASVVAYLRHRGRWEDAARDLGIHRNTLRHRIGTANRVMGSDLNDPDVASRLWLALRAAGLA
jgi:purine catabolism regulator